MSETISSLEAYRSARRPTKEVELPGDEGREPITLVIQRINAAAYSELMDLQGDKDHMGEEEATQAIWLLCHAGMPMFAGMARESVERELTLDDAIYLAGEISDWNGLNESAEDLAKNSDSAQDSDSK